MKDWTKIIVGAVGDFVSLLGYLSIPPGEAIGTTFAIVRFALPIIATAFGFLAGWGVRGLAQQAKAETADNLYSEIEQLRYELANERIENKNLYNRLGVNGVSVNAAEIAAEVKKLVDEERNDPSRLWRSEPTVLQPQPFGAGVRLSVNPPDEIDGDGN